MLILGLLLNIIGSLFIVFSLGEAPGIKMSGKAPATFVRPKLVKAGIILLIVGFLCMLINAVC